MNEWQEEGRFRLLTIAAIRHDFTGSGTGSVRGPILQWQEHLLLLQRTQIQFPAPTWQLTTVCNSSFKVI